MSSPSDRAYHSEDLSLYAPKWAREGDPERRVRRGGLRAVESEPDNVTALPERGSERVVIDRVRIPRSLEPGMIPEPPPPLKLRSPFSLWRRLAIAFVLAAMVAFFAVGKIPAPWLGEAVNSATDSGSSISRLSDQSAKQAESAPVPAAQLAYVETQSGLQAQPITAGEPAPLGVSVRNGGDGNAIVVAGLPAGASLSAGYPYGAGGWRVPARELGDVIVYPPRGFSGQMALGVELRDPNDVVTERHTLRLDWAPPKLALQTETAAPAPRALDRDEIEILLSRGQELLASGDISAARLMFKRAAEAQSARAAFALASTYDPLVLQRANVIGMKPDVGVARKWYEKAKEFGSSEASRRLEMLVASGL